MCFTAYIIFELSFIYGTALIIEVVFSHLYWKPFFNNGCAKDEC